MTEFERDLKRAMRDVAARDIRPGLAEELCATLGQSQPRSTRRAYVLSAVAGMAAAAAIVAAISGVSGGQATPRHTVDPAPRTFADYNGIGVVGPGEPCPNARHSPPTVLAAAAKQPIWLPDKLPSRVTDAWSCGVGSAPVLMFDDIQVSYEPGWASVDLERKWATYIDEDGGYTTRIQGFSVLVHPATDKAPNNEVMLVRGDTLIRFLSVRTVPVDQMVNLAKSFNLSSPAIPVS